MLNQVVSKALTRPVSLHLTVKHRLIGVHVVSVGTLDASLVHMPHGRIQPVEGDVEVALVHTYRMSSSAARDMNASGERVNVYTATQPNSTTRSRRTNASRCQYGIRAEAVKDRNRPSVHVCLDGAPDQVPAIGRSGG